MVSTSIPTLSIAAISSAKAQKHTEYYNTKHGKIATDHQFGHLPTPPLRDHRAPPDRRRAPPPPAYSRPVVRCRRPSRRSAAPAPPAAAVPARGGRRRADKSAINRRGRAAGPRRGAARGSRCRRLRAVFGWIIEGLRALRRLTRRPRPCLPAAPAPRDSNDTTR